MDIKEVQTEIGRIHGLIEHPRLAAYIALSEEIGEIADMVMKIEIYEDEKTLEKLKSEIVDALVCLCDLASVYKIDLNDEFVNSLPKRRANAEKWISKYSDILKAKRERLNLPLKLDEQM